MQIISIGPSDLIWKVFITIKNLTNEKSKKLNFFIDSIVININCDLKLPLNKITYFDNIIIRFDDIDKVEHRGKTCYFLNAYVWKIKIIFPA